MYGIAQYSGLCGTGIYGEIRRILGLCWGMGRPFVPLIVERGEYYRLFTSMFLHFGIEHLFNNMLVLIFLGDMPGKAGRKVALPFDLSVGRIGEGNLLSLAMELRSGEFAVSAGASGAIFAVIGALVFLVRPAQGKEFQASVEDVFC